MRAAPYPEVDRVAVREPAREPAGHFACARLQCVVGDDFGEKEMKAFEGRDIDTLDIGDAASYRDADQRLRREPLFI